MVKHRHGIGSIELCLICKMLEINGRDRANLKLGSDLFQCHFVLYVYSLQILHGNIQPSYLGFACGSKVELVDFALASTEFKKG